MPGLLTRRFRPGLKTKKGDKSKTVAASNAWLRTRQMAISRTPRQPTSRRISLPSVTHGVG